MNRRLPVLTWMACLLIAFAVQAYAQTDTTSQEVNASRLLEQIQILRLSDSIRQSVILDQLDGISTKEVAKRRELEKQLAEIRTVDSLKLANLRREIELKRATTVGYPVTLGDDTLFSIYLPFGSFSARERAAFNSKTIEEVIRGFRDDDSLLLVNSDNLTQVLYQESVLFSVSEPDALWMGTDHDALARSYRNRLIVSIRDFQESRSLSTLLMQIGLMCLVLLVLTFSIWAVNKLFRVWVIGVLEQRKDLWFRGISIKGYEFLNPAKQLSGALIVVKLVRYIINGLLLYIAIPLIFSIFPVTKHIADTLFSWILNPVVTICKKILAYLPDLFIILVIWVMMRYLIAFVKYLMKEIEEERLQIHGFYPDWAPATYNILRFLLYAFTFVMIFPYLPGSDSPIFKGMSVFIGVVFSLGSSSAISNMVAGLVITYMRPFKVGDHIKIGDMVGDIQEKTPFVTRMLTHKQEIVTIPNSNILSSTIVNYSTTASRQGVIFHTTITIGYDVPWRQIHAMMVEAALRVEWILKEPAPFVLQTALNDFYVSYQLCAYTHNPEKQASINSALHQNIQDVFNENGVEIMSPHYSTLRDGNATAIPANYLPSDYTPPPFTIKKSL